MPTQYFTKLLNKKLAIGKKKSPGGAQNFPNQLLNFKMFLPTVKKFAASGRAGRNQEKRLRTMTRIDCKDLIEDQDSFKVPEKKIK